MVQYFPPLNASLNALSGIFLLIAYVHIRNRRIDQHRRVLARGHAPALNVPEHLDPIEAFVRTAGT